MTKNLKCIIHRCFDSVQRSLRKTRERKNQISACFISQQIFHRFIQGIQHTKFLGERRQRVFELSVSRVIGVNVLEEGGKYGGGVIEIIRVYFYVCFGLRRSEVYGE